MRICDPTCNNIHMINHIVTSVRTRKDGLQAIIYEEMTQNLSKLGEDDDDKDHHNPNLCHPSDLFL